MQTFIKWLESGLMMKLGGSLSIEIKYDIMKLAQNYNYTGKEITNILQAKGYEVTYPQVMTILTPIFKKRKQDKRLEKLNVPLNLPMPMGVTGPQYKSTYVRPSPYEEPAEESPQFAYDASLPNVGAFNPYRSGLYMMAKRRNKKVY